MQLIEFFIILLMIVAGISTWVWVNGGLLLKSIVWLTERSWPMWISILITSGLIYLDAAFGVLMVDELRSIFMDVETRHTWAIMYAVSCVVGLLLLGKLGLCQRANPVSRLDMLLYSPLLATLSLSCIISTIIMGVYSA